MVGTRDEVGELLDPVDIEASHLSQQLALLRRAGLVTSRKQGSSVIYAIKDPTTVELLRVARDRGDVVQAFGGCGHGRLFRSGALDDIHANA